MGEKKGVGVVKKYLTIREAAEVMRISRKTLNKLVKRGYIKCYSIVKNRRVIEESEIYRYIDSCCRQDGV